MSNKVIVGIVAVVLIVGGAWAFSSHKGSDDAMMPEGAMMQEDSVMQKDDTMMKSDDAMMPEGDTMQKEGDAMMQEDTSMPKEGDTMMQGDAMMHSAGSYEAYDASKLAMAKEGKVILFFRASWCPTCRTLDADIKSHLDAIPADVTILDVNYDTATELKAKYGITTQHTLVQVDADGNELTKWVGSNSLEEFLTHVK